MSHFMPSPLHGLPLPLQQQQQKPPPSQRQAPTSRLMLPLLRGLPLPLPQQAPMSHVTQFSLPGALLMLPAELFVVLKTDKSPLVARDDESATFLASKGCFESNVAPRLSKMCNMLSSI